MPSPVVENEPWPICGNTPRPVSRIGLVSPPVSTSTVSPTMTPRRSIVSLPSTISSSDAAARPSTMPTVTAPRTDWRSNAATATPLTATSP